ncbi:MAG TPA: phosphorylase [Pseudolabrys sp.]|nr:phosphorylase [Pseudolabrys sp.]
MSSKGGVVAVTCLALEARIARGPGVSVLCMQTPGLGAALRSAIAQGASGIISFGIAGGLAPDLVAGDWVVASGVRGEKHTIPTDRAWSQGLMNALPCAVHADVVGWDSLVASPEEKFQLHEETGAAAVDMESHIAAAVAAEYHIPFAACRVIIDAAQRALPPAATLGLHLDGTPDVPAVLRSVWQNPRQIPALIRTAIDYRIAEQALRRGRKKLGTGLAFPYYRNLSVELGLPVSSPSLVR